MVRFVYINHYFKEPHHYDPYHNIRNSGDFKNMIASRLDTEFRKLYNDFIRKDVDNLVEKIGFIQSNIVETEYELFIPPNLFERLLLTAIQLHREDIALALVRIFMGDGAKLSRHRAKYVAMPYNEESLLKLFEGDLDYVEADEDLVQKQYEYFSEKLSRLVLPITKEVSIIDIEALWR